MIQNKNTTPKGGGKMKKLLFVLLACFISVSLVSLGNAQDVCEGLEGSAYDLCGAYCEAQDCDSPDVIKKSCMMLKKNYAKHTGVTYFPCDIVACCFCSSGGQSNEGQGCEEISDAECVAQGGMSVGEYFCEDVSCTLESDEPGCVIGEPNPLGIIPPCINGISDVCLPFGQPEPPYCPRGPRLCTFLGGTLTDDSCPGVPLCEE